MNETCLQYCAYPMPRNLQKMRLETMESQRVAMRLKQLRKEQTLAHITKRAAHLLQPSPIMA
jgi:uncharacterized HAD superfamily protein